MSSITYEDDEREKIEELRRRLKDVLKSESSEDTYMLLRFLRARNNDTKAAEAMLRKNLKWRKEENIDGILSWNPPEVLQKYFGFNVIGVCKDGSPIIYMDVGKLDIRGLLLCVNLADAMNIIIKTLENLMKTMKDQRKKHKKVASQWCIILNFESIPLSIATHKPSLEAIAKMVFVYESHYPEMLKNAIIINASWYFQLMYAFVKPLLTGHTLQKIHIFGKEEWKEELLKHIDADRLPAFLGGNKTDPDGNPMCETFINHCGKVPRSYYAVNNKSNFVNQADVKKLNVNRLSKEKIELTVLYPESVIEWEIQTTGKDIALTLLYQAKHRSEEEVEQIFPKRRLSTSVCPEIGVFKCDKPGTYFLEFDNAYSWLCSKEVYYKVDIVAPQSQDKQNNGA